MLHELITANRDRIMQRCRAKAAARTIPPSSDVEREHGVPLFLEQLRRALRLGEPRPEIGTSATSDGHQGVTASQLVHVYGDACQAISELAMELNAPISAEDLRILDRCLDEAMTAAVTEDGRDRARSGSERQFTHGHEPLGFFAHELRNLMNTALMALEVLKATNAGVGGNAGTVVLQRALMASHALIARWLAEVRLAKGLQNRELFLIDEFVEEVVSASTLEADARGIGLTVTPIEESVSIEADRQVLAAVIGNLLQNAFKFTRPGTAVTLRVEASSERVLIEIQDECGGLSSADVDGLFSPFEQRGADRSGLGLGLAFSRWGTEANNGRIHARSLPGRGCVFTVDLPRARVPAVTGR